MGIHKQQSTSPCAYVVWQNRNEGKTLFWMAEGSAKQNRMIFSVEVCSIASCIIPVADYVSLILCLYRRNIAKNTIPRQSMLWMVDQTSLRLMCCRFKFDAQHGHNNLQKILSRPGNVMVSDDNIPLSCVQVAWDHSHLLCLFRKMTVMVHMDSAVPVKNYKRYQIL